VSVPDGYPRAYERLLRVRPIVPQDAPALADAIRGADRETLRRRFLGGSPHVTPALLTRLTVLDYQRRFALVAIDPSTGRGIGIARYEPVADGVAEVAVAVDPLWRRVGLATVLVELLASAALERGVHTFAASYLAENRPVGALLEHVSGAGRQRIRAGIAEVAVALDRAEVSEAVVEVPPEGPAPTAPGR
jgi:RimJ/RimL family protein N-acetyltransferase